MTFEEILDQAIALLQRRGRLTYGMLKLQFQLDDEHRSPALSRNHKERGHEAWALRLLGEIALHRDPPAVEQAEDHYRQALALAEDLGMRPLVAHCHLGLGTLYAKLAWREQARTELASAIELYRAMEMMFWLPQAEAALLQMEAR